MFVTKFAYSTLDSDAMIVPIFAYYWLITISIAWVWLLLRQLIHSSQNRALNVVYQYWLNITHVQKRVQIMWQSLHFRAFYNLFAYNGVISWQFPIHSHRQIIPDFETFLVRASQTFPRIFLKCVTELSLGHHLTNKDIEYVDNRHI